MEEPKEVAEREAPTPAVVRSLKMQVARLADGRWQIRAPWLDGSVVGDTWPEAYWKAVKRK